jgi:hypothetical protein
VTTQAEIALMQSIRDKYHNQIAQAAASSSVPGEFLAALVANESGGRPDAKRFERAVLASLWEVLQGRAAHYGSIGRGDLYVYLLPAVGDLEPPADLRTFVSGNLTTALQRLDSLATSWGLTQIMGYEGIAFDCEPGAFQDPVGALHYTCRMLALESTGRGVDLSKDFSEMFDIWNTGRPHAPTADPQYIPNGLARMNIYRDLQEQAPVAQPEPGAVERV